MNKKNPERGVWIVYDLEANREIQTLLQNKRFDFRFDPSLKIEKKKTLSEVNKKIDISFCGYDDNLKWTTRAVRLKLKELKKEVNKNGL